MRRGLHGLDVAPRADARIGKPLCAKSRKRLGIKPLPFTLRERLIPVEPKPSEILDRLRLRARLVLGMVEILHAQDHLAAGLTRTEPRNHERAHIAKMQGARRAWRQPANISISQHGSFKSPRHLLD